MARAVKRRPYDGTRRRAHSADTRRRILVAARDLFLAGGYRGTSVTAIAQRAKVNPDTVYTLVGSKPALLRELIEQAVSHADHAVPAEERDYVLAIRAEPDARRKLEIYAAALVTTQQRLAPLYRVVREVAPSEPDVAALWREISERRLEHMHRFVADVAAAQPLRPGLTTADGAHHVWLLNSPDVYLLLSDDRKWSTGEIREWLATTWERLLLA
jgi:AcrR family transcriptional regulator